MARWLHSVRGEVTEMRVPWHRALEPDVPRPPPLRPTWITWAWVALAVCVLVGTVVGLLLATVPYTIP